MKDKNIKNQHSAQALADDARENVSGGYRVIRDSETGEITGLDLSEEETFFLLENPGWNKNLPNPDIRYQAAHNAAIDWLQSHGFNEKHGSRER